MRTTSFLLLLLFMLVGKLTASTEKEPQVIEVRGPTIVAFFPPTTGTDAEGNNEAFNDFQWYASQVRMRLQKTDIAFHEIYADEFSLKTGNSTTKFRPKGVQVGYYFIAPGKKPRVEYGVMTDADLMQVADEYFGRAR